MGISFFAKRAFRRAPEGYLMRVSSIIRAEQIAQYLGAKLNPTEGYQNDVCIYVKPHVKPGNDFKFEGRPYLDIIDGWNLIHLLNQHPSVPAIACSQMDVETLSKNIKNRIFLIPQQHCNFERVKRTRDEMTTIGIIGTPHAFPLLPKDLKPELEKRGMKLLEYSHFMSRQDIVNFYKDIDIQIVWRPFEVMLSNPLKIVNASSFGVPTIALDELVFKEVSGCYIPVNNFNEFLTQLDKLRSSKNLYPEYSQRCLEKAKKYHIENIAKLYRDLE